MSYEFATMASKQTPTKIPPAQNSTFRNPSWNTASQTMPNANSQNIYLTARHSPQLYGMRAGSFGELLFTDSAMDATMMAAPISFCRGVKEHPVNTKIVQSSVSDRMCISFDVKYTPDHGVKT